MILILILNLILVPRILGVVGGWLGNPTRVSTSRDSPNSRIPNPDPDSDDDSDPKTKLGTRILGIVGG